MNGVVHKRCHSTLLPGNHASTSVRERQGCCIHLLLCCSMPMLDVIVDAEATCTYSEEHAAWIHYKRNHFNLSAELICTRLGYPDNATSIRT